MPDFFDSPPGEQVPEVESRAHRSCHVSWLVFWIPGMLVFVSFTLLLYRGGVFQDWQEMLTEPWLINQGLKHYSDIATHHAPLLTEFLALLYRAFGTAPGVRMVLLFLASLITSILLARAVCRLAGPGTALFSILLFTFLWPFYGGMNFWFDSFLPLFYLAAFVFLTEKRSLGFAFFSGMAMGLAFLVKQHGGVVALAAMAMILMRPGSIGVRAREAACFSGGVMLPVAAAVFWYAHTGQLGDAFYWTILYNLSDHYVSMGSVRPPAGEIFRLLILAAPVLYFTGSALAAGGLRERLTWDFLLAAVIGLSASLTVYPRWERWHLAPMVPFLVLCLAVSLKGMFSGRHQWACFRQGFRFPKVLLGLWLVIVAADIGTYYPPYIISRAIPGFTEYWPFPTHGLPAWVDKDFLRYWEDIPAVGEAIGRETARDDRILTWGFGLERIHHDAGRLPAGRFFYALPWFSCLPELQEDVAEIFCNQRPAFVVVAVEQYPGNPDLPGIGIKLEEYGYEMRSELRERFPGVIIWKSVDQPAEDICLPGSQGAEGPLAEKVKRGV